MIAQILAGVSDLPGLINALAHQKQCDRDGIDCQVSRQAVEEALTVLRVLSRLSQQSTTYIQNVPDKCDRIIWRGHYYHLPPLKWTPVNFCHATQVCLAEYPKDGELYIVRGSEMYRFTLPELPPPDSSIGTGTEMIEKLLGGARDA